MQREVILAVGQTGMGKTTWVRNYISNLTRVIVAAAGFAGDYNIEEAPDFKTLTEKIKRPFFRIAYSPRYYEWPFVFEAARISGETSGPLHLVMEEAYRAGDTREMPEYDEAVNQGRHWGLSLIAISTRAAKLPTDYKAQVTRIIAFRQHLPNDIDYLEDIIGEDAYELQNLKPFAYLDWTPAGTKFQREGRKQNERKANTDEPKSHEADLPTQLDSGGSGNGSNPGGRTPQGHHDNQGRDLSDVRGSEKS